MSTWKLSKSRKSNLRELNLNPLEAVEERYSIWQEVLAVAQKNNSTISEISDVIGQDDDLRKEILFLAKCAKNYNGRPVTSVEQAIMLVGVDKICNAIEERRKLRLTA